jgi:hypothetical protein
VRDQPSQIEFYPKEIAADFDRVWNTDWKLSKPFGICASETRKRFESLLGCEDKGFAERMDHGAYEQIVPSFIAYACCGSLPTTVIRRENVASGGRARSTALLAPAATIHS